jgi:hypothetical protein
MMKTYDGPRISPAAFRATMVKLTNATEEFVILLHASSFSPPSTPRSHSPMVLAPPTLGLGPEDGTKLGVSLSRSRSAQVTKAPQAGAPPREVPRSAAPHQQTFKLSPHPRLGPGLRRENRPEGGGDSLG